MSARISLPTSPDEAIRAVTIVDTTAEVASEAQHASPEPTELALAQTVEAPKTPQLARAAEAYARVQGGLPNIAVGRYLRVQA
jgi:hypothetical protein